MSSSLIDGICRQTDCTVSHDGRCLDGFGTVTECPHFVHRSSTGEVEPRPDENEAAACQADEGGKTVALAPGNDLDMESVSTVMRGNITRVVLIGGAADSGKTTLLTSIYESLQKGPFAQYRFAGSYTLLGFERRCHRARITSERSSPDTARTPLPEGVRFLHLRLRPVSKSQSSEDLLLADMAGEMFRLLRDSTEECRRMAVLGRADHFVLLLDGAKLAEPALRSNAFNDASVLLRSCLDSGSLDAETLVDVVISKEDVVRRAQDQAALSTYLAHVEATLYRRFGERLPKLRIEHVAARPDAGSPLPFAYGLDRLLPRWVEEVRHLKVPGDQAVAAEEFVREFDRFILRQGYGRAPRR